jgi:hypothetical protein
MTEAAGTSRGNSRFQRGGNYLYRALASSLTLTLTPLPSLDNVELRPKAWINLTYQSQAFCPTQAGMKDAIGVSGERYALSPILQSVDAFCVRAMRAAVNASCCLYTMTNDFAVAMAALWRQGMNGAFEAVEISGDTIDNNFQVLVVFVSANFALMHFASLVFISFILGPGGVPGEWREPFDHARLLPHLLRRALWCIPVRRRRVPPALSFPWIQGLPASDCSREVLHPVMAEDLNLLRPLAPVEPHQGQSSTTFLENAH